MKIPQAATRKIKICDDVFKTRKLSDFLCAQPIVEVFKDIENNEMII
jgi:hypothetical protein